ncbi:hypothetical protein [Streptomyces sp. AA4]|nr:hypothetical protein [Streptomyces sp. AA4]
MRAYDERPDWKYGAVGRFAAGHPLAWLDDHLAVAETALRQGKS